MKNILKIISIGYFIYGFAMLAFVGVRIIKIIEASASDPNFAIFAPQGIPVLSLSLIGLLLFGLACWLGYLLYKLEKRKFAIALSCVLMLGIPIGTVLGLATLCLIQTKEIKDAFGS